VDNNNNSTFSGLVRVYENINGEWSQLGNDIEGEITFEHFGYTISLNAEGNILAVGTYNYNHWDGQVRIFKNIEDNWIQIGIGINNDFPNNPSFQDKVRLNGDGSTVAIGYSRKDIGGVENAGLASVFDLSSILLTEEFSTQKFTLYPNPTKNQFTIQLQDSSQLEKVTIYNNLGQFISTSKEHIIDTSSLKSGVYFVEVKTGKGTSTQKLIIE